MLADRIEAKWIDAFCEIFERCAVKSGDTAAILSETQSRALNVHLAELALLRMGAQPFHIVVPTPRNRQIVPIRSTGASEAIQRLAPVVSALQQAGFVVDCTIEGPDARGGDAGNSESRRAHSGDLQRAPRSAGAHGARHGTGKAGARGGENAARNQADARDLQSGHRTRRRYGRRLDRRRLGLDRQTGHAGALARRHRRQLSQERHRQRHAGDGGRRHQPHLQALSDRADPDDAEGRLRHRSAKARAPTP